MTANRRVDEEVVTIYGNHMPTNHKTTVYLDAESYRRLKLLAQRSARPTAELVREAVVEYAGRHAKLAPPSSVGAGRSGRGDVSERAETLLKGMGRRR
jgi:predicted transcriptional regulator